MICNDVWIIVVNRVRLCTASTVANADQQQNDDDGATTMCGGGRHRRKHWIADDGCNECKCSSKSSMVDNVEDKSAVMSCTNMWCGPATFDCLSGVMPCTGTNQVTFTVIYNYYTRLIMFDAFAVNTIEHRCTVCIDNVEMGSRTFRVHVHSNFDSILCIIINIIYL